MERAVSICLGLAVVLSCAEPAAAAPREFGPDISGLISQAAQEGHLQLSWSGSNFGDNGKDVPQWIAAFNQFYGLHLTSTFTPALSMPQQAAGIIQAAESGTPSSSDLIVLEPGTLATAAEAKASRPYDWQLLAKEIGVALPTSAVATENAGVAFATGVYSITYNKNEVATDKLPRSLEDVLKPQWKGRIASTPYAAGFDLLTFDPQWGPTRTEAFVTKLAQQIGGLLRCGEPGPLLSGQFDMLVLDCDVAAAIMDGRRGMPIGYVIPRDAPITFLWYMVVPKTSRNPAAAALLALFMLTKEGQTLSWNSDGNDLALFPDSHTVALLPNGAGATITVQNFADHAETSKALYVKMKALYVQALRRQ